MLWRFCRILELTAAIWGAAAFAYYWDPTRTAVMRLKAADPSIYEEIDPRFQSVPVRDLITVRGPADVAATRRALSGVIWADGGFPGARTPDAVIRDVGSRAGSSPCPGKGDEVIYFATLACRIGLYAGIANLARIDRLEIAVGSAYRSVAAEFRPRRANGKVVLYHHGYAGTYHSQHRNLARLIERGVTVVALNLPGYGDNNAADHTGPYPETGLEAARWILTPVIVAVNHVATRFAPEDISMIGFSAGGWATAMAAALDSRIRSSFVIAAPYPLAYRETPRSGPEISRVPELVSAANHFDLYVLGAAGDGRGRRRQMHIYNQFDRCCWNNRIGTLFEMPVKEAAARLGGAFAVRIDTSHARHKVSRHAMDWIMDALEGESF